MFELLFAAFALATWPVIVFTIVCAILLLGLTYNDRHGWGLTLVAAVAGVTYYLFPNWFAGLTLELVVTYFLLGAAYIVLESIRNWINLKRGIAWLTDEAAKNPRVLAENWELREKMASDFYQKFTVLQIGTKGVAFSTKKWLAAVLVSCVFLWPFHACASLLNILFKDLFQMIAELFRSVVMFVYERTLKRQLDSLNSMFETEES